MKRAKAGAGQDHALHTGNRRDAHLRRDEFFFVRAAAAMLPNYGFIAELLPGRGILLVRSIKGVCAVVAVLYVLGAIPAGIAKSQGFWLDVLEEAVTLYSFTRG